MSPPWGSSYARFVAAMVVDAIGSGMYLPVSLLYFHHITHLPMTEVGVILTAAGLLRLAGNQAAGSLVDRFGGQAVVVGGYLLRAVGFAGFFLVRSPAQMFAAVALVAIGDGSFPPAVQSFVAEIADQGNRDRLFGAQRSLRNAGLGAGGLLVGALLALNSDAAYQAVVLGDAASFLIAAALTYAIASQRRAGRGAPARRPRERCQGVLRDRPFLALTLANLPIAIGYMVLSVALPVYVTQQLRAPASLVGILYAVNTVGVAAFQIPVTRLLARHRRTRSVALGGAVFSASFLLFAVFGIASAGITLVIGLFAATVLFTAGELLQGATASALVASAAPEQSRGRYLAFYQYSWVIPTIAAPAALTALLNLSATAMWLLLAAGVACSAAAMMALEPALPAQAVRPWAAPAPGVVRELNAGRR